MLYPILTQSRLLSDLSGVWDFKLDMQIQCQFQLLTMI